MTRYIHVENWDKFQHYGDRNPPWIKNHIRLLHSDEYLALSGHQRGVLHGLWLAYAISDRQLSDNTLTLARQLGLRVLTRDLEALNHAGFITFSASKSASIEERRVEEKKNPPNPPSENGKIKEPKPAPKPRAIDPLWDTLVEIFGASAEGIERGKWNKALQSLRASGATPDTLRAAAANYPKVFNAVPMTAMALAGNWTTLTANGKHPEQPKLSRYDQARLWVADGGWRLQDHDLRDELGARGLEGPEKARLIDLALSLQAANGAEVLF